MTKKTYPLFGISVNTNGTTWADTSGEFQIISRGETQEQAVEYCTSNLDCVQRYHHQILTSLPIDAAKEYGSNHEDGWLHREPEWVKKSREAGRTIYNW